MSDDVDQNAETETHSTELPIAGSRIWQTLRPPLEQAALNLRVWLPVLSTPDMKGRQVKYRARESRVGLKWQLALPKQCWQCGKTDGLERRETNQSLRCFDNPVAIVSGSFGSALLLLLVWVFALGVAAETVAAVDDRRQRAAIHQELERAGANYHLDLP